MPRKTSRVSRLIRQTMSRIGSFVMPKKPKAAPRRKVRASSAADLRATERSVGSRYPSRPWIRASDQYGTMRGKIIKRLGDQVEILTDSGNREYVDVSTVRPRSAVPKR